MCHTGIPRPDRAIHASGTAEQRLNSCYTTGNYVHLCYEIIEFTDDCCYLSCVLLKLRCCRVDPRCSCVLLQAFVDQRGLQHPHPQVTIQCTNNET